MTTYNAGINRGYGFYSPNVRNSNLEFTHLINDNISPPLFKTSQGRMRMNIFMINTQDLLTKEDKLKVYRNIYRMYNTNNDVEKFSIKLKMTKYKRFGQPNFKKSKEIDVYKFE